MIGWKQLFLSPRGRVGRQTFVLATALLVTANIMLALIPFLGPLAALPLLWPFACVTAKRLHDAGRSAAAAFVAGALCLATGTLAALLGIMATDDMLAAPAFALAGLALLLSGFTSVAGLAVLLWAALAKGDPAANRYGVVEVAPLTLSQLLGDDHS